MTADGGRPRNWKDLLLHGPARASQWRTLSAACLGLAMLMIDTFVVNVAFPAISRDLRAGLSTAEWTVTGYILAMGVLPVATGRLGDIFGRRRVYLLGLALFTAASAACGAAGSIYALIAFRVVQGVGAAIMQPATLAITTQAFPPHQRGLAIGTWGGVSGLGLIIGPVLGGLLVQGDGWRWVFLVNLPVGLLGLLLALLFIPESRDESVPRSVDWAGLGLSAAGLLLILLGFTRANQDGWTSPVILGCFAGGALLLAAFVAAERRARYPLVDLSLFRSGTFVMACLSSFLFAAAVFGSQPYTSLFMQNFWGFTPLEGGLAFLPSTALVAALMPFSGVLGQRLGSRLRLLVMAGSVSVGVSFLYLLRLEADSGYTVGLLPAFILRGLGVGLVMAATSLAVMSAVPLAKAGLASGTYTMARQIGTAVGVAVLGAVFLHHVETDLPGRLAGLPPEQAAPAVAAAAHFAPAGEGEARAAAQDTILEGFILLAVAGMAISAVATAAAGFIRHRAPAPQPVTPQALAQQDGAMPDAPTAGGG
ncbi:MAG TPA: MFS transporter [Dehalococcoidia bacterium]